MSTWVLVAVGGAAGAVSRHGITLAVGARDLPVATFLINISGALLLGVVLAWSLRGPWSPELTRAVGVGFLGAYTTFSTFSWEILALGRGDRLAAALAYAVGSVVLGVLAAGVGYRIGGGMQG